MAENVLKKLKLSEQLSGDPFKIFVLVEKSIVFSLLIAVIFIFMDEFSLRNGFSGWEVVGGTIGYLAITAKKMYCDEAFSELRVRADMQLGLLRDAMLSIGYSEKYDGVYLPCGRNASFLFDYKSEVVTCTIQRDGAIFTGPYDRLVKLSRAMQ
ncbi:hypothetical protein [Pseudomonas sp. NFACC05-1]|uniref:hypothetical protein n=1 Tax=Pseudomonas sp. NFACC05-1 TaxID=1566241 RepID=UPI000B8A062D|nr:hypothetical protein [Pseudomonas sp. NFACC05-1]